MTIIGFTGLARSGKDTAAKVLVDDYGYERVAFAGPLKALALAINPIILVAGSDDSVVRLDEVIELHGAEKAKGFDEVRRFYQALGTLAREYLGSDIWIQAWLNALPEVAVDPVVATDVRFLNEAEAVRQLGGLIVRIKRNGSGLAGEAGQHPSEVEQASIIADYTITNNGSLEELRAEIATLVGTL